LHLRTEKNLLVFGYSPFSMYLTQVRKVPSGTSFSDLQATVQAWQPMHARWSITNPYLMRWLSLIPDRSRMTRIPQLIRAGRRNSLFLWRNLVVGSMVRSANVERIDHPLRDFTAA